MDKPLTVGQVAELTGLSRKSIRYYEAEKLIPKAGRSATGYRHYDPKVIERLKFIQKAKAIGFALEDVRRILELTDRGKPCCGKVSEWSAKKLSELEEQIRFLLKLRKKLVHYRRKWELQAQSLTMPESEICNLIESIELDQGKNIPNTKSK